MCFRRKLTLRCSLSSGGGGAFGAVTSFTFRLHDQRPTVGFATAMFAQDQLPVVMSKVHKWLEVSPPVSRAISRVRLNRFSFAFSFRFERLKRWERWLASRWKGNLSSSSWPSTMDLPTSVNRSSQTSSRVRSRSRSASSLDSLADHLTSSSLQLPSRDKR